MRINLWAGPGAGKSTLCSRLFSDLKIKGYNIEQIHEYIKTWAYLERWPREFDQIYIFAKQLHAEDVVFQSGVEHIITDCPLLLTIPYSIVYNSPAWEHAAAIGKSFEEAHPSLNLFLDRSQIPYKELGRYQGQDEAHKIDDLIKKTMDEHLDEWYTVNACDPEAALDLIEAHLGPVS